MRRISRWVLAVHLALLATVAGAQTLVVVGDSISAGYGVPANKTWVKLLEQRIAAKGYDATVINASVSGDTTAGGLTRLPMLLRQHRPDIVVIELGGNDGLRGLRLQNTRDNLTKMVRLAKKEKARVLLLGMDLPPSYGANYVRDFRAMYPSVAKNAGAAFQPGFLEKVGRDPDMMQSDGIHPNSLGQPVLLDTVWGTLEPLLKR